MCLVFSTFFLQIGEHINKTIISERVLHKNPAERKQNGPRCEYMRILDVHPQKS